MSTRVVTACLVTLAAAAALQATEAFAQTGTGWEGRRRISYQDPHDLFYNYYVGPQPSGTAAELYTAPLPVPEHVGHTYNTYQPLYPHEFLYRHNRSYYTHTPGGGWTRTKVRYRTGGGRLLSWLYKGQRESVIAPLTTLPDHIAPWNVTQTATH